MRPTATRAELTDGDLIKLSATEPESFGAIFDRHAPAIHHYLSRRVGRTLADDLMAETFLTAFKSRSAYDLSRPDARPWLYGIAANLLRGHQRTEIRLGNQATGFVQNALRWKIKPEAAGELYAEYRGFDNIGPGLVNQELAAALNFAFSGYDMFGGSVGSIGSIDSLRVQR